MTPVERQARALALFDQLVELSAPERARQLQSWDDEDAALATELRRLLDADALTHQPLDRGMATERVDSRDEADSASWTRARAGSSYGGFVLSTLIGRGGMGEVWLAEREQEGFVQRVALKLLRSGLDSDDLLRRFLQERRILAELSHPHIARFIDGGVGPDGQPWYAMDFVEGEPITQHAANHALSVRERVELLLEVAETVAYAQSRMVVHRDLKPSNILVSAQGRAHLLDFGIAKLLQPERDHHDTMTGLTAMSPAYAAPEQILDQPVSAATDVYALGLLLYELLTGRLPHERAELPLTALAAEVTQERFERPSQQLRQATTMPAGIDRQHFLRDLQRDLDAIVMMALRPEPARRYPTAAALADDLRRWLQGRSVLAAGDSASYRLGKLLRRHRVAVTAAALVLVALLGGLGAALWQAQRAEAEAQRASKSLAFLTGLFRGGDPRSGLQVDSVDELLALGAQRAEKDLGDDPLLQGMVMLRLAEVRANRREFGAAEPLIERALSLLEPRLADDDLRLANAWYVAGMIHEGAARSEQAEPLLRRSAASYASAGLLAEEAGALSVLAGSLRRTRDIPAALQLQREVLGKLEASLGPDHHQTALARSDLATFAEDAGDYELAESSQRQALAVFETLGRSGDPARAHGMFVLAGLLDRVGRAEEAGPLFESSIALMESLYGPDSEPVASARFSQGIYLLGQQQLAAAEQAFRRTAEHSQVNPVLRAHAQRYLGIALRDQGQLVAAIEQLQLAEQAYRELGGTALELQAARAGADRGHALVLSGEIDAGIELLRASLAGIRQVRGDRHAELILPGIQLGQALAAQGQIAPASAELESALALALELLGTDHPRTEVARQALAAVR
ncbi:MAG: serine/threonine-protein kinase [Lysobacterales bacterium]